MHFGIKPKIHFIGIGGIGMSGIAEVLVNLGYQVSGSDMAEGYTLERLRSIGIKINVGHHEQNMDDPDVVVYSSAISEKNPEFQAAKKNGIPVLRRAEMLSELMRLKQGIAVAGTHGKTTTSSLLASLFIQCEKDPTYIIGGVIKDFGTNARVGKGDLLIVEADESDGTFLLYNPVYSIITNIDNDHLDYYQEEEKIDQAFIQFANRVPFYGACIINEDDPRTQKIKQHITRPLITVSLENSKADFYASNIQHKENGTILDLYFRSNFVAQIKIPLLGRHNVLNTLSVIAIAKKYGLGFEQIFEGLTKFKGVKRRFDLIYQNSDCSIIDDYAHHPTEIKATIHSALKSLGNNIEVVFEPHRFSRTQSCWNEFIQAFEGVKKVYIGPIYSAGEKSLPGISHNKLVEEINKKYPATAVALDNFQQMENVFKNKRPEKVFYLTLGAGAISKEMRDLVQKLC